MNSDQYKGGKRKNHDVKHVKAQQSVFSHDVAAEKQEAHFVPDERHGGNDIDADGDGPERKLIPGQQIAGVTEEQDQEEGHEREHPVELMRRFVAATVEEDKHAPEDGDDN